MRTAGDADAVARDLADQVLFPDHGRVPAGD